MLLIFIGGYNMTVMRLKSTGEVVHVLASHGNWYDCLFRFKKVSKKGNRGVVQSVRKEKLEEVKQGYHYG